MNLSRLYALLILGKKASSSATFALFKDGKGLPDIDGLLRFFPDCYEFPNENRTIKYNLSEVAEVVRTVSNIEPSPSQSAVPSLEPSFAPLAAPSIQQHYDLSAAPSFAFDLSNCLECILEDDPVKCCNSPVEDSILYYLFQLRLHSKRLDQRPEQKFGWFFIIFDIIWIVLGKLVDHLILLFLHR